MRTIPYARQNINEDDITAVTEVLRSDFITQGNLIGIFEEALCERVGSKYSVATNSGTSALFIAYRAMGVQPGDLVWTSPNTFAATANAAILCGANVDFVDIDPETYNVCPKKLLQKINEAKKERRLPKLLVVVHFAGLSAEMKMIAEICDTHFIRLVEDASHALGAEYHNSPVGSCKYSDATVFSFHPVKTITTGEGGAVQTKDKNLFEKMQSLRTHGSVPCGGKEKNNRTEMWYYEQIDCSLNFRITDIQCALGERQLRRMDEFLENRQKAFDFYQEALASLDIQLPHTSPHQKSANHLYPIVIKQSNKPSRNEVIKELRKRGILANIHYIPVYLHPFYQKLGFSRGLCPNAENYFKQTISLPMFPDLTTSDQEYICETLGAVLKNGRFIS